MTTINALNNKSAPFTVTSGNLSVTSGNINTVAGSITSATTLTATLGDITATSGNLKLPTTSSTVGQIQINSERHYHAYGTFNTFLGALSGNFTLTVASSTYNTAVGGRTLQDLTSNAQGNCAFGYGCLQHVTTGASNIGQGIISLNALTQGSYNLACGDRTLYRLATGSYNIAYGLDPAGSGYGAGYGYTGAESSNIVFHATGTTGESNKIRIGTQGTGNGQQNACYIAGIYNTAVGATAGVVLSDSSHQLGGLAGAANTVFIGGTKPSFTATPTLTSVLATTFDTNVAAAAVTLTGTTLSADGSDADININITAKGAGQVIIDDLQLTTDLAVTEGGTGASTLTDHGILLGSGTGAITPLAAATDGQLPIGSTGADPVLATLTAGTGISVTNAAGSITIAATGSILVWSEITAATKTIVVQEAYVANRGTLITFTLPATAALGTEFKIQGLGAGGWKIEQAAGQTIHVGSSASTTGAAGYIASSNQWDAVSIVCVVADTGFSVQSAVGNITVA